MHNELKANESEFFQKKAAKQVLVLEFEENDNILPELRKAIKENEITDCKVVEGKGILKNLEMNYFSGNNYKYRKGFGDETVTACSGRFLTENEVHGDLHITVAKGNQRINGTLLKAVSGKNFVIKLEFIKL